jgi:hypothetical protein
MRFSKVIKVLRYPFVIAVAGRPFTQKSTQIENFINTFLFIPFSHAFLSREAGKKSRNDRNMHIRKRGARWSYVG